MRLPVCCCCLLLLVALVRGQEDEFSLDDALDSPEPTKPQPRVTPGVMPKKPTAKPPPGGGEDAGFDLIDAFGEDDTSKLPTKKPQPGQGGGGDAGGVFDDSDLGDGLSPDNPSGHDDNPDGHKRPIGEGQGEEGENKGLLAGIISTVVVAAVGAVSSFIAYQKKKLCFKGATDDPENVNMDSHKGDQSEPQAQSTLLAH